MFDRESIHSGKMRRIVDAARINRVKYAVIPEDGSEIMEFSDLDDARYYMTTKPFIKYFYAFDVDDENNFIKIRAIYMDRYTERDIKDRLLANKAGSGQYRPIY